VSAEIGLDFDVTRAVNYGYLPRHYLDDEPQALIRSYVQDYLANEIVAEGLVRNLPVFLNFLGAAALSDTEMVNYATIARDCGVSLNGVKGYFQILQDTLLGTYLPAYTKRPKRRVIRTPKFYFADVGVVNHLAKRRMLEPGGEAFGKAFENWVFHELNAHRHYTEKFYDLSYWRLAGGTEIDFIAGDMKCAIEAKGCLRATSDHLKGLREVIRDHSRIQRRVLVCMEARPRRTDDGIDILPATEFAKRLWRGDLIPADA
jgi:predicted AAA+ superfamily ATPase